MRKITRLKNIIRCYGWSFCIDNYEINRRVALPGEQVILRALIRNNGLRIGTAYVIFHLYDSYDYNNCIFNSHEHLDDAEKRSLRLVDVNVNDTKEAWCIFQVPNMRVLPKHLDIDIEVWNPHFLFDGPNKYMFDKTGKVGGFEIINQKEKNIIAFISYSWDDEEHKKWIMEFCDELRRNGIEPILDIKDLHPAQDIIKFMERIKNSDVVLIICSTNYTNKANDRRGGVGMETIITSKEFMDSAEGDREKFIPILRNNDLPAESAIPLYLGKRLYIDMRDNNWRGEAMSKLVSACKKISKGPLRKRPENDLNE